MKTVRVICLTLGVVAAGDVVGLSAAPRNIFLTFNGTSSAVLLSNSTMLGEGSGPLTVSAWVKPAVLGTATVFVSKMSGASFQWVLGRAKTNRCCSR